MPGDRPGGRLALVGAGLLHSMLMALAFAPVGLWGCALVAIAPLVWASRRLGRRAWIGALWVTLGVVPLWAFEVAWVWTISAFGYPPMVLHLAAFAGCFVWILHRTGLGGRGRVLASGAAWTAIEVLRGEWTWGGYPWLLIGHPLIDAPLVPAIAAWAGVYAVCFWAAILGALVAEAVEPGARRARLALAGAMWVVAGVLPGAATARPGPGRTVRVALVQTNVPVSNKIAWSFAQRERDFERFIELSSRAVMTDPAPELIVWPETMYPGLGLNAESLKAEARLGFSTGAFGELMPELQRSLGAPMLVGATACMGLRIEGEGDEERVEFDRLYNSAFVIADGRVLPDRYDKIDLTPFGEYMPIFSRFAWLERLMLGIGASGMTFDLTAGDTPRVLEIPVASGVVRAATPICYESASSGLCRRLAYESGRRRADLLINITNDGWFAWWDAGRRQSVQIARWRCVELGTPMIRAANTGISAIIDAQGRVLGIGIDGQRGAARVDGVLGGKVELASGSTFFGKIGNMFGWICVIGTVVVIPFGIVKRRTAHRAEK